MSAIFVGNFILNPKLPHFLSLHQETDPHEKAKDLTIVNLNSGNGDSTMRDRLCCKHNRN